MESRKNSWRRELAAKARQDRTIVAYLQLKRPDSYNEAVEYYNSLNQKYPSKLDLRKTEEFHALKSSLNGETPIKKPKKTKRTYAKRTFPNITPVKNSAQETAKVINDNMELNIQLMSHPKTTEPSDKIHKEIEQIMGELRQDPILASFFSNPPTETPTEPPTEPPTETLTEPAEITIDITPTEPPTEPPIETLPEPAEITIDITPTEPPTEPPIETLTEPAEITIDITPTITEEIPQRIIDEIVEELQKDHELEQIFDEMDIDIEIPSSSPLEDELLSW